MMRGRRADVARLAEYSQHIIYKINILLNKYEVIFIRVRSTAD